MSRSGPVAHLVVVVLLAAGVFVTEAVGVVPHVPTPRAAADFCGFAVCPGDPPPAEDAGYVVSALWYYDVATQRYVQTLGSVPYGGYPETTFTIGVWFTDSRGRMASASDVGIVADADCTMSAVTRQGSYYLFDVTLHAGTWQYCSVHVTGMVDGKFIFDRYITKVIDFPQTLGWLDADGRGIPTPGALFEGQPTLIGVSSTAPAVLEIGYPPVSIDVLDFTATASGECTAAFDHEVGSNAYFLVTPTGVGTCRLRVDSTSRMAGWASGTIETDVPVYPKQNIVDWGGWVQWMADAAPPVTLTYPADAAAVVGGGSAGGEVLLNHSGACSAVLDPSFPNEGTLKRWLVTPTGIGDCNLTLTALVIRLDGGATPALNVTIPVAPPLIPNRVPVPDFTVTQPDTNAPSPVSFDASGTTDPDGDPVTFWWDFGNGSTAEGVTASTTYTRAGTYDVTLTAFDPAGVPVTIAEQVIVTDATPPVIRGTLTGTEGGDGWHTSDIAIVFDVADLESDVTGTTGCDSISVTTDIAETPFTCTATSAGGTASRTLFVKRDATPPTLGPTVTPDPVAVGALATASANADDGMSGLASSSCDVPDTNVVGQRLVSCTATDVAGNIASGAATFNVVDVTAPQITPTVHGTLGDGGWYTSDVDVSWTVVDLDSPVASSTGCDTTTVTTDTSGSTFTCTATSAGGTASQTVVVMRDATAPTLSPSVTPSIVVVGGAAAATANATDAGSGIVAQNCGSPATAIPGDQSVSCTATDKAGNSASASAEYTVVYAWQGFRWPVDAPPTVNKMKAGLGAPIRFSLVGSLGPDVLAGTPTSQRVSCPRRGTVDAVELKVPAWSSPGLTYNGKTGEYTYVWKTQTSWKGTCREFTLALRDGTTHTLVFQFT